MRDLPQSTYFYSYHGAGGGLEGGNEFYKQRKANTKMENEERDAAHLKPWGIYSRVVL